MFKDILELVTKYTKVDDSGDSDGLKVYREIFCDKKSVRQSEFYQAHATGLKAEIMFEIWCDEYNDEKQIRYNQKEYEIIRTYSKDGEILELTCSGGVNNSTT